MGINFGNNTSKFFTNASDSAFSSTVNISVIGVGGAGGNIIKYLSEKKLPNVNLICANTDMQAMMETSASNIIQLGKNTTRGLGAGSNPDVGEKSAIEASEEIKAALHGTDMLILVSGLGGGTGTGATPVISSIAREMGILTLTFAVTPFDFELERKKLCERGIDNLLKSTDSLITLSNQKLLSLYNDNLTFVDALTMVNDIVYQAIMGVVNLLLKKELINRDFSDIMQVMKNKGHSIISIGRARGEGRAVTATTEALTNPLLSDVSIKGATGMIITICAAQNSLKLSEVNDVMNSILLETNAETVKPNILFGTSFMDELQDEMQVSIIATGLKSTNFNSISDEKNINYTGSELTGFNTLNDYENISEKKDSFDKMDIDLGSEKHDKVDGRTDESYQNFEVNLEDIGEEDKKSDIVNTVVKDNFSIENTHGFFTEFFSKSKSFDSLLDNFKEENLEQKTENKNCENSPSPEKDFGLISDSDDDESLRFLSADELDEKDNFFSGVEVDENINQSIDSKLLDNLDSEKDDNILFLTDKQNPKKHDGFYSKQVDIFELIGSITANK